MRIFLSAGEASGDAYGAALVQEIRRMADKQLSFEAIGGPKLRKEGVTIHADSSKWGAISISQGIRVGFGILPHYFRVKRLLASGKPGLFIPIDFGFANIRLAKHAKKSGWKVLYFVPPGSWRRDRQGKDLPAITDQIVTPFEWSAEILNRMGAKAHWFGHPILQLIREASSAHIESISPPPYPPPTPSSHGEALLEEQVPSVDSKSPAKHAEALIGVLPGSRAHELEMTLPLIAKAVHLQTENWAKMEVPGIPSDQIQIPISPLANRIEFALAPSVNAKDFQAKWNLLAPGRNDIFTVGDTYGVLKRAKVAIVCSGTATLEAAICRCPMLIIYQLSPTMRREAKLLRIKQPKFIGLPNIIQDREIVPELASGHGVYPEQVRAWLERLLNADGVRNQQIQNLDELVASLGPDDAITKTAELALSMAST